MPRTKAKMRRITRSHSRNELQSEHDEHPSADENDLHTRATKRRYDPRATRFSESPDGSLSSSAEGRSGTRGADEEEDEYDDGTTDKATSQMVINWVRENYQYERDHNVPRRGMYEHYKAFCSLCHLQPVNSATFGKLIRTVFPDIKTRRLGTRGQSKYHYCGIRMRHARLTTPSSSGSGVVCSMFPMADTETNTTSRPYIVPMSIDTDSPLSPFMSRKAHMAERMLPPPTPRERYPRPVYDHSQPSPNPAQAASLQRQELSPCRSFDLPPFTTPIFPPSTSFEYIAAASKFTQMYEKHCRDVLSLVTSGQFDKMECALSDFYLRMPDSYRDLLRHASAMVDAIWRWDCALYDAMARIFVAKFRRHLSLNHMAQAAESVLGRSDELRAMTEDWEHVDVGGVIDQALWVCDCRNAEIERIMKSDIAGLLQGAAGLDRWMVWCENIVNEHMSKAKGLDCGQFLFLSKQLVLKWTMYSSLIMRDLTLRNAATHGSYHILQLFFDDYMLYLVEERIAQMNATLARTVLSGNPSFYGPADNDEPLLSTPPPSTSSGTRTKGTDIQDTSTMSSSSVTTCPGASNAGSIPSEQIPRHEK